MRRKKRAASGGGGRAGAGKPKRRPTARAALRDLADRLGIVAEYLDQTGKERRKTSDETRVALAAVMGFDASTEARAKESLDRLFEEDRAMMIPPVAVVRADELRERPLARVEGQGGKVSWTLSVLDESGREVGDGERSAATTTGSAVVAYPPGLAPGYYAVTLTLDMAGAELQARQTLVVSPGRCPSPADVGAARVFGLIANLYTVRGENDWGIGNAGDLQRLVEWGGELGAGFVGVNPLHALFNRGDDVSPYSPVSRLFRNPLYIDVAALLAVTESRETRAMLASRDLRDVRRKLSAATRIDYERIAATLDPILRAAHGAFLDRHRGQRTEQWAELERYVRGQGRWLEDFATFMAIDHHQSRASGGSRRRRSWREWPARFRDPRSEAVAAFRAAHADEVEYHCWLQFTLDSQLGDAAAAARGAGMPIGLYQDLAIGSSPDGSDTWAYPDLFITGASIGAPPDPYSATGQNWGLPPLDPRRLALDGYRYWIALVRGALRHAGALRIDHVMGLFQQFWIPEGETGEKGAYVRFPADDLLGILALEATRANAVVVGEDLGTVPAQVPPALLERQVVSSKVLYFERTKDGGFADSSAYPQLSLATANTHDMPTLAGWWEGRDIDLRRAAGLLGSGKRNDPAVRKARTSREQEKRALADRLDAEGVLPPGDPTSESVRGAVHAFLCKSPAAMVGVALDDLAGEVEPVNLPGVGPDRFPSWRRRMKATLDEIRGSGGVKDALGCDTRRS